MALNLGQIYRNAKSEENIEQKEERKRRRRRRRRKRREEAEKKRIEELGEEAFERWKENNSFDKQTFESIDIDSP